jgi:hypothetical protein
MAQRITLDSSAIEAVTYDETNGTLDVEFVYHALVNAESAGAFWNAVKDRFEYAKLD